jgi:ribosome maturation factor RimP
LGFELVQARMVGSTRRTLQVMAEPIDRRRRMSVDDCAAISHAISAVLDVADPIPGTYTLEVSSPGIDRPLVRPEDFVRFAGFEAKLESEPPIGGRRRFHGTVRGFEDDAVLIEQEGELVRVPFASVRKAKLVLSDALIRHAAAEQQG